MVLLTLLELGVQSSVFVIKKTYYLGKYLVWGREKTKEEILEEQLKQQIEKERKMMNEFKYELNSLKTDLLLKQQSSSQTDQPTQNGGTNDNLHAISIPSVINLPQQPTRRKSI